MTAEAELKHMKLHSGKELEQAREDLLGRLEEAQAIAEQRVEEHTEEYRLQVRAQSCPGSQASHCSAAVGKIVPQHQLRARSTVLGLQQANPLSSKCTQRESAAALAKQKGTGYGGRQQQCAAFDGGGGSPKCSTKDMQP